MPLLSLQKRPITPSSFSFAFFGVAFKQPKPTKGKLPKRPFSLGVFSWCFSTEVAELLALKFLPLMQAGTLGEEADVFSWVGFCFQEENQQFGYMGLQFFKKGFEVSFCLNKIGFKTTWLCLFW